MPCGLPMDAFREACGESMPLQEAKEIVSRPDSAATLLKAMYGAGKKIGVSGTAHENNKLALLRRALEALVDGGFSR